MSAIVAAVFVVLDVACVWKQVRDRRRRPHEVRCSCWPEPCSFDPTTAIDGFDVSTDGGSD